ncbi:MAG: phosphate ABC transporter permease subunit PstC [Anaerolineae bacterium]|nr:phosphate ABC transporter permease subunit PstC [Anaerolineae bacterium]
MMTTAFPLLIVILMIVALLVRTRPILESKPIGDLLLGQTWHPLRGEFGFYPFIIGTLWITLAAMLLAVPPCLLSAVFLAEYARPVIGAIMKPLLDLLAGIPSVVYGVWGLVAIVPWVQTIAAPASQQWLDFLPFFAVNNTTGYSILAGAIVLAVMVAPVIISVTYEVMQAVPDGLRESSLAVGATRWQTIKHVVVPKAAPGILIGIVLGFSRAFGETMAVLMVVGNVPRVPSSIFDPAYPLTALIANNYGEMLSIPLYDSALMGAALVLLMVVLIFNLASALLLQHILRRSQT